MLWTRVEVSTESLTAKMLWTRAGASTESLTAKMLWTRAGAGVGTERVGGSEAEQKQSVSKSVDR